MSNNKVILKYRGWVNYFCKFDILSYLVCLSYQAYVRHPEVASAKANRDFVMKQMSEAVNAISGATQATGTSGPHPLETPGALASALDDFDVSLAQLQGCLEKSLK